jgi:hypothetical protein
VADLEGTVAQAFGELDPQGETIDSLAARLPAFPRSAVDEALAMLSDAGVLRRETAPDGTVRYFYADPSRYKLADMDVIRQPDGATRRPGGRLR